MIKIDKITLQNFRFFADFKNFRHDDAIVTLGALEALLTVFC